MQEWGKIMRWVRSSRKQHALLTLVSQVISHSMAVYLIVLAFQAEHQVHSRRCLKLNRQKKVKLVINLVGAAQTSQYLASYLP